MFEVVDDTLAPSLQPSSAISAAPSLQPRSDYSIVLEEDSVNVGFDDASSAGEISFALKVTKGKAGEVRPIKVLDYSTCNDTSFSNDIINATHVADIATGTDFDRVAVNLDINTGNLANYVGSIYTEDNSTNTASIQFCTLAEIGSVTIDNNGVDVDSSISYVKIKFNLDINLEVGFDSASVQVQEIAAIEDSQTVGIEYPGVEAVGWRR
mmetsp:Transcript_1881/g.2772  ORF Transcript_1881/g.2772 Transcript_1881/m.2772 type:complete len:210 (+) Transcript_1881:380-1009(+)